MNLMYHLTVNIFDTFGEISEPLKILMMSQTYIEKIAVIMSQDRSKEQLQYKATLKLFSELPILNFEC